MRGRIPKASWQKQIEGTYKGSGEEIVSAMPDCPLWLDDAAKAEWGRLMPLMVEAGALEEIDGNALGAYCTAISDLQRFKAILEKEGEVVRSQSGYMMPHPCVAMRKDAMKRIKDFGQELGLSPVSRMKLRLPEKPDAPDEVDEIMSM